MPAFARKVGLFIKTKKAKGLSKRTLSGGGSRGLSLDERRRDATERSATPVVLLGTQGQRATTVRGRKIHYSSVGGSHVVGGDSKSWYVAVGNVVNVCHVNHAKKQRNKQKKKPEDPRRTLIRSLL